MNTFTNWLLAALLPALLLATPSPGQRRASPLDSLRQQLAAAPPDTNRVQLLIQLAYVTSDDNPVASGGYARQGLQLASRLLYPRGQSKAYMALGRSLTNSGNFPAALQMHLQALRLAETLRDQQVIATVYNALGDFYGAQKIYRTQLAYFLRAEVLARKNHDTRLLTRIMGNTGGAYFHLGKLDSAARYTRAGYALDLRQRDWLSEIGDLRLLGSIEARRGPGPRARAYYQRSLTEARRWNITYALPATYLGLAELAQAGGRLDSAVHFARQALAAGQRYRYPNDVLDASSYLSRLYVARHDSAAAYRSLALANATRDSMFSQTKMVRMQTLTISEQLRRQELAEQQAKATARQRQMLLLSALLCALPALLLLWRNNRLKEQTNAQLHQLNQAVTHQKQDLQTQRDQLDTSLTELRVTQAQLIQKEKMASLGELTAGIAHEIQNPLNFVNNFSEVSAELCEEARELLAATSLPAPEKEELTELLADLAQNLGKIGHHGRRAAGIVKGMLEHSQSSAGERQPTDLNRLCDEYLRLAYQGLRAKDKSFNAALTTDFLPDLPPVTLVGADVGRVLLNLFTNAFYAVRQRQQLSEPGYQPQVGVRTVLLNQQVHIQVTDNGTGMSEAVQDKIFQPFFTTKPPGEGTGLGLSLSHDIIAQGHGGTLSVESEHGQGTTFTICLPH